MQDGGCVHCPSHDPEDGMGHERPDGRARAETGERHPRLFHGMLADQGMHRGEDHRQHRQDDKAVPGADGQVPTGALSDGGDADGL